MKSHFKYCQGPKCHTYRTKDRIRGYKGDKHYETRKRSYLYFDLFCSQQCQHDWLDKFGDMAVNHCGRIHEPKRNDCDNAWYKDYTWQGSGNHDYYFKNDLLGQRISITQQQYRDENFTTPN